MANRKFWERVGGNRIRFYDEPTEVLMDETLARIAEIDEILTAPNHVKALIVQAAPQLESEAQFEAFFQDEKEELAERLDYWDMDTITESIDVADTGWFKPVDGQLGPGVVLAVCGEEVGNEAALAIDGTAGTNWQHDFNHETDPDPDEPRYHEIIIDLGYKRRIDGLRFQVGATPGNPLLKSLVNVYVNRTINGLTNNPAAQVGVDLDFSDPADIVANFIEKDLTPRNGRYLRITIGATAHAQNHITVRELQIRQRPRTFNL